MGFYKPWPIPGAEDKLDDVGEETKEDSTQYAYATKFERDIASLGELTSHLDAVSTIAWEIKRDDWKKEADELHKEDHTKRLHFIAQTIVALGETLHLLEEAIQAGTAKSSEMLKISEPKTVLEVMLVLQWALRAVKEVDASIWAVPFSEVDKAKILTRLRKVKKALSQYDEDTGIRQSLAEKKRRRKRDAEDARSKKLRNRDLMEKEWQAKFGVSIKEEGAKQEFEEWWRLISKPKIHPLDIPKVEPPKFVRGGQYHRATTDVSVAAEYIGCNLYERTVVKYPRRYRSYNERSLGYRNDFAQIFVNDMSSETRKAFLDIYLVGVEVDTYRDITGSKLGTDRYCRQISLKDVSPTIIANQLAKFGPDFPKYAKNLEVDIRLPKLTKLHKFSNSNPTLILGTSGYKVVEETFAEIKKYTALENFTVELTIPHNLYDGQLHDLQLCFFLPLFSLKLKRWVLKYNAHNGAKKVSDKDRERLDKLHEVITREQGVPDLVTGLGSVLDLASFEDGDQE